MRTKKIDWNDLRFVLSQIHLELICENRGSVLEHRQADIIGEVTGPGGDHVKG